MPFPICTIGGGLAQGMPDVCKVPTPAGPIPTPFPNIAQLTMAAPPVVKVMIDGSPSINLNAKVSLSQGDEAGAAGGVVSGSIMGPVSFARGSVSVFIDGAPAVFMTANTTHNNNNAVGLVSAPSQAVAFLNA